MKFIPILLWLVLATLPALSAGLPSVSSYDLAMNISPDQEQLKATCKVTLTNKGLEPILRIPFLLYRLLEVTEVLDASGKPLKFDQQVTRMTDERAWQVTSVSVLLPEPLQVSKSLTITIKYQGYIYGYPEIMQYTKERISPDYTLIRNDVFAYPIFCEPSQVSLRSAFEDVFSYRALVSVPMGYRVASGGQLAKVDTVGDLLSYSYRSKVDVSRIDLAAAEFQVLTDTASHLVVFHLPQDSLGAGYVMQAMRDAITYYTERFGAAPGFAGYTVIEIPDGWGSQAGKFYILQTAASFKDSTRVSEVYHEVGHTWNAKSAGTTQRCRYFDEAFASYFESLTLGRIRGDSAFREDMKSSRSYYVKRTEQSPEGRTTPIAGYGAKELGGYSYTKGAWSLYVLNQLICDNAFNQLIRSMLIEYSDKPIDFQSFMSLAEKVSKRKLDKYFEEWIFGVESSQLLVSGQTVEQIVSRYK